MTGTSFRIRRLFLSLVGAAYFVAFASWWSQMDGLVGEHGIVPAANFVSNVNSQLGAGAFWRVPSIALWSQRIGSVDSMLNGICAAGIMASLLSVFGYLPRLTAIVSWALYLSLASVGGVFMHYQWDILLLETGLIAVMLAPWSTTPAAQRREWVPVAGIFLTRFLLFRLMFLSGFVKLASGDATWINLGALRFHYFTQPLPTALGYFAHQLPGALHTACCAIMFFIELVVPFFIFGPRKLRLVAAALLVLLQLAISATGNYGFFNLLTLVLCVPLLDDRALLAITPRRIRSTFWRGHSPGAVDGPQHPPALPRRLAYLAVVSSLVVLESATSLQRISPQTRIPEWIEDAQQKVAPFRSVAAYGLFAVMTTERPVIVVEGSSDGKKWRTYPFRYMPLALDKAPRLSAPHMPRLDWQMWFAALGECQRTPWFQLFLMRLLEGTPEVVDLLAGNPFPDGPPRFIRSTKFQYKFTSTSELLDSGNWWERTKVGEYCPVVKLENHRLVPADSAQE